MTFHCITYPSQQQTIKFLAAACQDRQVAFNLINPDEVDYTDASIHPAPGDLLYRSSIIRSGERASGIAEIHLLTDQVATFYHSYERALNRNVTSFIMHQKAGLPIPRTIPRLTRDRALLKKYVAYVGGFPVIIKADGGSHGVGVMKVDSMNSLISITDYLHQNHQYVIMRQFINVSTSARLIALGNKVVSSIEYAAPEDDFRSNVGLFPQVQPKEFPSQINDLAVAATKLRGVDFGGVDILIDSQGQPYITEINFPCNFARAQRVTGIDIAGQMVDYLIQKSKQVTK